MALDRRYIRVNIGCGVTALQNYVNCDRYQTRSTDLVFDCQEPWPLQWNSVREIMSIHMLEHLEDPRHFFRYAWDVLGPEGLMRCNLPYGHSKSAWWDIEHVRPWYPENFAFLQPGYGRSIGNPEHADWPYPYQIVMTYMRLSLKMARLCRYRLLRKLILPHLYHVFDAFTEITVDLMALKTPEAVWAFFAEGRTPNIFPVKFVAFEDDILGRPRQSSSLRTLGMSLLAIPGE